MKVEKKLVVYEWHVKTLMVAFCPQYFEEMNVRELHVVSLCCSLPIVVCCDLLSWMPEWFRSCFYALLFLEFFISHSC